MVAHATLCPCGMRKCVSLYRLCISGDPHSVHVGTASTNTTDSETGLQTVFTTDGSSTKLAVFTIDRS